MNANVRKNQPFTPLANKRPKRTAQIEAMPLKISEERSEEETSQSSFSLDNSTKTQKRKLVSNIAIVSEEKKEEKPEKDGKRKFREINKENANPQTNLKINTESCAAKIKLFTERIPQNFEVEKQKERANSRAQRKKRKVD